TSAASSRPISLATPRIAFSRRTTEVGGRPPPSPRSWDPVKQWEVTVGVDPRTAKAAASLNDTISKPSRGHCVVTAGHSIYQIEPLSPAPPRRGPRARAARFFLPPPPPAKPVDSAIDAPVEYAADSLRGSQT